MGKDRKCRALPICMASDFYSSSSKANWAFQLQINLQNFGWEARSISHRPHAHGSPRIIILISYLPCAACVSRSGIALQHQGWAGWEEKYSLFFACPFPCHPNTFWIANCELSARGSAMVNMIYRQQTSLWLRPSLACKNQMQISQNSREHVPMLSILLGIWGQDLLPVRANITLHKLFYES